MNRSITMTFQIFVSEWQGGSPIATIPAMGLSAVGESDDAAIARVERLAHEIAEHQERFRRECDKLLDISTNEDKDVAQKAWAEVERLSREHYVAIKTLKRRAGRMEG